jgi:membrane peptidoglycan carboxypeptidase
MALRIERVFQATVVAQDVNMPYFGRANTALSGSRAYFGKPASDLALSGSLHRRSHQ